MGESEKVLSCNSESEPSTEYLPLRSGNFKKKKKKKSAAYYQVIMRAANINFYGSYSRFEVFKCLPCFSNIDLLSLSYFIPT